VAVFLVLHVPLHVGLIPYGEVVGDAIIGLLDRPVIWFGESMLGFEEVVHRMTNIGDTAFDWSWLALSGVLAIAGAGVWTVMTKRREESAVLGWVYVALRYGLGLTMIFYGLIKVLPSQFPAPQGDWLLRPLGDLPPMGLLWTYMGFSHGFNIVTGAVEVLGGLLLLFRRTWLAGALVTVIAMAQVVAVNFLFDVPVKILSSQLLVAALVLTLPFWRRLATALFSDQALPVRTPAPLALPDRARPFKTPFKLALLAVCLGFMVNTAWQAYNDVGRGANFELAGIYDVTSPTESERWNSPTTH